MTIGACKRSLWSRFYAPGLTVLVVQRNTTRDKQKAKIVIDAVREHGLVKATGDAELYKMDLFHKYKVLDGEPLSIYVVCKVCFSQGDYALAQISRGSCAPRNRSTTNVRTHLRTHHKETYDLLLGHEHDAQGKSGLKINQMFSLRAKNGPVHQNEADTVDAMLHLVAENLDPWSRMRSHGMTKLLQSIHPHAWIPSIATLQQRAVDKVSTHLPTMYVMMYAHARTRTHVCM
jgi:hypothetical protein